VIAIYRNGKENFRQALETRQARRRERINQFGRENEKVEKVFKQFCGAKGDDEWDRPSKNLNRSMLQVYEQLCINKLVKKLKILEKVRSEFKMIYDRPFTLDFIGLTGAGLQLNSSSIKILVRCSSFEKDGEIVRPHATNIMNALYRKYSKLAKDQCEPWVPNSDLKLAALNTEKRCLYLTFDDPDSALTYTVKLYFDSANRSHRVKSA
jgi:hypothetical protein